MYAMGRPHSLHAALTSGDLRFDEAFVLVMETDHLPLKPLPNLLEAGTDALGYPFHYMAPRRDARCGSQRHPFSHDAYGDHMLM